MNTNKPEGTELVSDTHLLSEVIAILYVLRGKENGPYIDGFSNLYADIDLDSLQVLSLSETLRERFGLDVLNSAEAFKILSTPNSIVRAIRNISKTRIG